MQSWPPSLTDHGWVGLGKVIMKRDEENKEDQEDETAPLLGGGAPCHYTREQEDDQQSLTRSGLLGWLLAVLSGILFTSNNFLVKYYTIEAVEMLMVRSSLQTLLMAVVIGNIQRNSPS